MLIVAGEYKEVDREVIEGCVSFVFMLATILKENGENEL